MSSVPWWKLYTGMDYVVGVRAEIWDKELFDYETKVLELKWLIAQAEEKTCPETVVYEGITYNVVQIGNQCWLKENLNVGIMIDSSGQNDNGIIEKYCYDNDPSNCATYGGLYTWNEMLHHPNLNETTSGIQGICPPGWHIPTYTEFQTLQHAVDSDGNALKAIGQGSGNGAGTNTSGFSALLAGKTAWGKNYFELATDAYFWSSTEEWMKAYELHLLDDSSSPYNTQGWDKVWAFSVRCIKD